MCIRYINRELFVSMTVYPYAAQLYDTGVGKYSAGMHCIVTVGSQKPKVQIPLVEVQGLRSLE